MQFPKYFQPTTQCYLQIRRFFQESGYTFEGEEAHYNVSMMVNNRTEVVVRADISTGLVVGVTEIPTRFIFYSRFF